MEIIKFYINPVKIIKERLNNNNFNWAFPLIIYLTSFLFINLLSFVNLMIFKMDGFHSAWYKVILLTLPFAVLYSITGWLLFRKEIDKLTTHLKLALLYISYVILILSSLTVVWTDILIYLNNVPSTLIYGIIFIGFIMISKLLFNYRIYKGKLRNVFGRSIIELVLVFILSFLLINGINSI